MDPETDPGTDPKVDPKGDPEADPEADPKVDPEGGSPVGSRDGSGGGAALTVLAEVQLGKAPSLEGLVQDGSVLPLGEGVQVHGLALHPAGKNGNGAAAVVDPNPG